MFIKLQPFINLSLPVTFRIHRKDFIVILMYDTFSHTSLSFYSIFRSFKNRFVIHHKAQQHVRSIHTTTHLLNSEVVKVPPFADSVSEGDVRYEKVSQSQCSLYFVFISTFRFDKKVGDAVAADEVVMEIETDKTTVGVPSPGKDNL